MSLKSNLPGDWELSPLHSVARIQTGLAKGKKNIEDPVSVPYLRVANVQDGYLDLKEIKNISVSRKETGRYALKTNDLLLTEGGDNDKLGRGHLWENEIPNCIHQNHVFVVRVDQKSVDPRFLAYYVGSPWGKRYFLGCSKQSTNLASINSTQLKQMPIPIPPVVEQQEIVSVIGIWDTAIETTRNLIESKRNLKKGLMQQLLTGKRRFPKFGKPARKLSELPEDWKRVELGDIFHEVTEKVGERTVVPYSITAGTGFVSQREKWGKDISGSQYSNYNLLRKGQFSYNKGNSKRYPCGCTYLLHHEDEIAVPNVFISFERSSDDVCPEFYEHYFLADYCARELRRFITSGARADGLLNLNKHDFFSVRLPLPSYREQRRIAEALSACDREIQLLSQKAEHLKNQKKGLMQKLLTGQIRVRGG